MGGGYTQFLYHPSLDQVHWQQSFNPGVVSDLVLCQTWCCVRPGVVSDLALCQTWCCVRPGVVSDLVLCQTWCCVRNQNIFPVAGLPNIPKLG